MATRTFESFIPNISPSVPGCPQPLLVQHIRDAAIRACERTLFWRYQIPLFNLLPGVHEYLYNVPSDTQVHAVFEAIMNDNPLHRLTLEQALERYPEWADLYSGQDPSVLWSLTPPGTLNSYQYNTTLFNGGSSFVLPESVVANGGQPRVFTQLSPEKFILLPLPDGDDTYRMRIFTALKPTRTATGMDEVVFNELEDAIMHGALQHLLVLPDKNWTDRELASYHAKQFVYHLADRRARANLGNMRGSMSVRMQPFA